MSCFGASRYGGLCCFAASHAASISAFHEGKTPLSCCLQLTFHCANTSHKQSFALLQSFFVPLHSSFSATSSANFCIPSFTCWCDRTISSNTELLLSGCDVFAISLTCFESARRRRGARTLPETLAGGWNLPEQSFFGALGYPIFAESSLAVLHQLMQLLEPSPDI